jgi:transcriptional regulator with XRE-family HTH domain
MFVSSSSIRNKTMAEVARIVREERIKQGLSLNLLAASAGLSRQMVSFIEKGERFPSLETLLRIAEALDVPLDVIIRRARTAASKRSPTGARSGDTRTEE